MGLLEIMMELIFSIICLEKYDATYGIVRCLIGLKQDIDMFYLKIDSGDNLPLEQAPIFLFS